MANSEAKAERKMPRGVRKGGAKFPRYTLDDSLGWARKLVSKTHLGPENKAVILAGVVGSSSSVGEVRISALKQYGLLDGESAAYVASILAKNIANAPSDELIPLYRQAALGPAIFKGLFDTFHGDSVSRAKLKQRAAELRVHPDETENCIDLYVSAMTTAKLGSADGDKITLVSSADLASGVKPAPLEDQVFDPIEVDSSDEGQQLDPEMPHQVQRSVSQKAIFNVSVTLDSSLDIEKLAKQLELLKKFGAI